MEARNYLIDENRIIYVATRLFNYADKLLAERLEASVIKGIVRAVPEISSSRGTPFTFVPFRDTGEHLIAGPDKARVIYEGDKQRLERLLAVVGFFDGPSKDEGMSFEIGYAFGNRIPIILILTDFFHFSSKFDARYTFAIDPILEVMTTELIRNYELDTGITFLESLELGLSNVLSTVEETMHDLCRDYPAYLSRANKLNGKLDHLHTKPIVYIDFGGGLYEWQRNMQTELASRLSSLNDIEILLGTRFDPRFSIQDVDDDSTISRQVAQRDITSASKADILILCGDNDEMGAGVAALQGLAAAQAKTIILYDSRPFWWRSDDGLNMSRNLMLDQSATVVLDSFDSIFDVVRNQLALTDCVGSGWHGVLERLL